MLINSFSSINFLKTADKVPLLSTATSLHQLFLKATTLRSLDREAILANHHYNYVNQKSTFRCIVLLVPVLGNIFITILDAVERIRASNQLRYDGVSLQDYSEQIQSDKELVMLAIKNNVQAFQYASQNLKGDKEFVMKAVEHNPHAFQYASQDLKGDKEFVLRLLKSILNKHHASSKMALSRDSRPMQEAEVLMQQVSNSLKRDKEFAAGIIDIIPSFFIFIDAQLKNTEKSVLDILVKTTTFRSINIPQTYLSSKKYMNLRS